MSDPDDLGGSTLLDALTAAGAAVDKAQVLGDVAAHRVVRAVARRADGGGGLPEAVAGDLAIACDRIAVDIALTSARYGLVQARHSDALERLMDAPGRDDLHELQGIEAEGTQGHAAARALIARIDAAERALG